MCGPYTGRRTNAEDILKNGKIFKPVFSGYLLSIQRFYFDTAECDFAVFGKKAEKCAFFLI